MNSIKVIAISGASGAGKTTIVKQLAEAFNCPFLLFDDYTDDDTYPEDMKQWLENGADVSTITTPGFVHALHALIAHSTSQYIFIEEPFGKERDAIARLIDYVVLLDQPLALCLTRLVKRHADQTHANALQSIESFLDRYQDHLRDIYRVTVNQVRGNSDLIIAKIMPIQQTTNTISYWLGQMDKHRK